MADIENLVDLDFWKAGGWSEIIRNAKTEYLCGHCCMLVSFLDSFKCHMNFYIQL